MNKPPWWANLCFWGALFIWFVPLAVSLVLLSLDPGNPEALGFWVITRAGPFIGVLADLGIMALLEAIAFDALFLGTAAIIYRRRKFRWSVALLVVLSLWFVLGMFLLVQNLHIA